MNIAWPLKLAKAQRNLLHQGINVQRVIVKLFDHVNRRRRRARLVISPPLLQAATRRGKRIVRVKGQQNELVNRGPSNLGNRFGSCRVPVTHRDGYVRFYCGAQRSFKCARLTFREGANRRMPADPFVVLCDTSRAPVCDPPCQRLAQCDSHCAKRDDVWIAKKIVEKWLDRFAAVRPAELEQNDTNSLTDLVAHRARFMAGPAHFPFQACFSRSTSSCKRATRPATVRW